jgi:hypothetical protein
VNYPSPIAVARENCAHCSGVSDKPCPKHDRPLFIPLKREWFEKFRDGSKTIEYRRLGPKWNPKVCWIGRPVILSNGYSGARITARIRKFTAITNPGIDLFPADAMLAEIHLCEIDIPEVLTITMQARGVIVQDENALEITVAEYQRLTLKLLKLIEAHGSTLTMTAGGALYFTPRKRS